MPSEITLSVTDHTTGAPAVSVGVETTLEMKLVNRTGTDVPLAADTRPATFRLYLPVPKFFTIEQLERMQVVAAGWRSSVDRAEAMIKIECTRADTWARDAVLTFAIERVRSDGPPDTDSVVVGPLNMAGVQVSVDTPFAVANAPKPGNLSLTDVLQVSLDSQGSIYRSDANDPLTNSLFLTFKNVGATPLATEKDRLPGAPEVSVAFVYGNTSGALAPDDRDFMRAGGSAWNIKVAPGPSQRAWETSNPRIDGQEPHPRWKMKPAKTNVEILGPAGSDGANVTFAFSHVVSLTPPGHTQALVLFTGFAKDAQTAYDDHLFVLDIVKLDAPPTRGLVSFFGPDPVVDVSAPTERPRIPLRWTMFHVASVQLLTSSAAVPPRTKVYPEPRPLAYDETTVTLPPLHTSEAIFITLQAFDGRGAYLNSLQFTAYTQVAYVKDPGGHVYRIALVGDTFWMLESYRFTTTGGSYAYQDDAKYVPTYGRLYDYAAAQASIPTGWKLPTVEDWKALFDHFGDKGAAYEALKPGGRSGFDAQLGGRRTLEPDGRGIYRDMRAYGYYWVAENRLFAQFSGVSQSVSVGSTAPEGAALSVRYIRHV